jgi:hypothetical protein
MPLANDQNIMILVYAQAGLTPQENHTIMGRIGDPVAYSTLCKHLARMRQNGNWEKWERGEGGFQSMFDRKCFSGETHPAWTPEGLRALS